jgi:hypothetical protein
VGSHNEQGKGTDPHHTQQAIVECYGTLEIVDAWVVSVPSTRVDGGFVVNFSGFFVAAETTESET